MSIKNNYKSLVIPALNFYKLNKKSSRCIFFMIDFAQIEI